MLRRRLKSRCSNFVNTLQVIAFSSFIGIIFASCDASESSNVNGRTVVASVLPAHIEAEDFSSAIDNSSGNSGDASCTKAANPNVDLAVCNDSSGCGCALGWTEPGEILDYFVVNPNATTSNYDMKFRVASAEPGAKIRVEMPPGVVQGRVTADGDGYQHSWDNWTTRQLSKVPVPPGRQALRLVFEGKVNLNFMDLGSLAGASPSQPSSPDPTAPAQQGPVSSAGPVLTYADIGSNATGKMINDVAVTEGVIRVRRRHENDMDFAKYNPFYWEGRLTKFKVEDYTSAGENRMKFTLETEWPQDYTPNRGPDFSAIYKGDPLAPSETLRSKFDINQRMKHVAGFSQFEATIGPDQFRAFPDMLKKGQLLIFEFRFFNNESHAPWQAQKAFNPHNLSAYYSEFLRVRIGEAGLIIEDYYNTEALPSPQRFSGGWMTTPTMRVEPWKALQQQANNLTFANAQTFLNGRTWFHTNFLTGQHVGDESDDKPSLFFDSMRLSRSGHAASAYNVLSCNSCHVNNGISMLPDEANLNRAVNSIVVKTLTKASGLPHQSFGQQLQTNGAHAEGTLKVGRFEKMPVQLDDGTTITLRKPIFTVENPLYSIQDLALSPRKPPALIGIGLLEAVPEQTIRNLASQSKGEVRMVNGRVGRFGWKADATSVRDQIVGALKNDMGVLSKDANTLDCFGNCKPGKGQLPEKAVEEMEAYVALLGVPPRTKPNDPKVKQGESVFLKIGCQNCHVQTLKTGSTKFPETSQQTIQAFTDLLLHDMGSGLADDSQGPDARKWRTAPLWGLKNVKHSTQSHIQKYPAGNTTIVYSDTQRTADGNPIQLLHDGRAQSIAEAILWHGGAAEDTVKRYKALSKAERDALESFLWDL